MRKAVIVLLIFFLAKSSLIGAQQISGSIKGAVGIPTSQIPSGLPTDLPAPWREKVENILRSDPEKKKVVDNFLEDHGLPKSDEISSKELAALIDKLNDPRGQPVDPSDAGPILMQAWKAIHPTQPVPLEIVNLEKEKTCSGAASTMIALRTELRTDASTSPFDPANFSNNAAITDAIKVIDGYLDACLQRPDSVGEIRKWLDSVVGALQYEDSEAEYCIATLVGPKHVLTARHCIFGFSNGHWYPLPWKALDFFLPAHETERRRIANIIEPIGTTPDVFLDNNDQADWIIMVLDSPIFTVKPPALEELHTLDKLFLYSKQPLVYHRDKLAGAVGISKIASALVDHVRVDQGESCRALIISANGCVTHGCQSEGGVSGAPLLRFSPDGKSLSVVAIHQGEVSSAYTGTCLPANQPRLPNRGRAVTSDLIAAVHNATNIP